MDLVKGEPDRLVPVDSEHSALAQCLRGERREDLKRVIVTASGGPFRGWTRQELAKASVKEALAHPTWNMGPKITIDSATLMNKGLEVIEAHYLFGLDYKRIDVVVHPESIIHGIAEFGDGSMIAQMAAHDMRLPIQLALAFPDRLGTGIKGLDLAKLGRLTFEELDREAFPAVDLAYREKWEPLKADNENVQKALKQIEEGGAKTLAEDYRKKFALQDELSQTMIAKNQAAEIIESL